MFNPFLIFSNRCRVVVEKQSDDRWVATLPGLPKLAAPARYPFGAVRNLMERAGDPKFTFESLRPVKTRMTKDHLEFEIERSDWRPTVLAN